MAGLTMMDELILLCSRFSYLNAIQTMCPHILRYLATAVIINRPRRSALKDLVKVIQQVCVCVCTVSTNCVYETNPMTI